MCHVRVVRRPIACDWLQSLAGSIITLLTVQPKKIMVSCVSITHSRVVIAIVRGWLCVGFLAMLEIPLRSAYCLGLLHDIAEHPTSAYCVVTDIDSIYSLLID